MLELLTRAVRSAGFTLRRGERGGARTCSPPKRHTKRVGTKNDIASQGNRGVACDALVVSQRAGCIPSGERIEEVVGTVVSEKS
jgi:hypothetical protein